MTFTSPSYLIFLLATYLVYVIVKNHNRWIVLLFSSIMFYSMLGAPHLIGTICFVIVFTYLIGKRLDKCSNDSVKFPLLIFGIFGNITALILIKYLPPIINNYYSGLIHTETALPNIESIGISYFTFQAISYLVDIYLGAITAEIHIGYFATYICYFPKLLQGPIERASDLIPQLKQNYVFNYDNIRQGLFLFTFGIYKKIVLADRLAIIVNPVYNDVHSHSGITFVVATYIYALQIFFDFAGYTDMARGTALLFNIELTQNFKYPYLATSVADFWRRWHISFSRCLLDYVFKPIQMLLRRSKTYGTAIALIITFFISGVWHGASWNFILWGLLHGIFLATSVFYGPIKKGIYNTLNLTNTFTIKLWQSIITFNLISFAWIFFRANNLADSIYIINSIYRDFIVGFFHNSYQSIMTAEIVELSKQRTMVEILLFLIIYHLYERLNANKKIFEHSAWIRWPAYYMIGAIIFFYGLLDGSKKFIYFQF